MPAEIVRFSFQGDSLDVLPLPDGAVAVGMRAVCEALGVDFPRQLKKAKADPSICVAMKATQIRGDDQRRNVAVLDLRSLPLWLATIHPSKVRPEIRDKLIAYKRECAEVLADHFVGARSVAAGQGPPPLLEEAARRAFALADERNKEAGMYAGHFIDAIADRDLWRSAWRRLFDTFDPLEVEPPARHRGTVAALPPVDLLCLPSPIRKLDWEAALGTKIARRARPIYLDGGMLLVATHTSQWAEECSKMADVIIAQLRKRKDVPPINALKFCPHLSFGQIRVFALLVAADDGRGFVRSVSARDIAERLSLSTAAASLCLDRLRRGGWIVPCEPSPQTFRLALRRHRES